MNLREQILNAKDIESETITIKQWKNAKIEVRGLNGQDRSKLLNDAIDQQSGKMNFEKLYPTLVIYTSYDPDSGERIFSEADRDFLNQKSGAALEQIANLALKLSGLQEGATNKAIKN